MACPTFEQLQDLVDGELATCEAALLLDHIRSCKRCDGQIRRMLVISDALGRIIGEEKCPGEDILDKYLAGALDLDQTADVERHVERCATCHWYVVLSRETDTTAARRVAQEERECNTYKVKYLGLGLAHEVISRLIPGAGISYEALWERLLNLIQDLIDKPLSEWPRFRESEQFMSVLGPVGMHKEATLQAAIAVTTILCTCMQVEFGELRRSLHEIESYVAKAVAQLGLSPHLRRPFNEFVCPRIALAPEPTLVFDDPLFLTRFNEMKASERRRTLTIVDFSSGKPIHGDMEHTRREVRWKFPIDVMPMARVGLLFLNELVGWIALYVDELKEPRGFAITEAQGILAEMAAVYPAEQQVREAASGGEEPYLSIGAAMRVNLRPVAQNRAQLTFVWSLPIESQ